MPLRALQHGFVDDSDGSAAASHESGLGRCSRDCGWENDEPWSSFVGATPKKSHKSSGFKARKRQTKRPLARTSKHKKGAAPSLRNLAGTACSGEKGSRKMIFEEAAARARERLAAAEEAPPAADAMQQ